MKIQCIKPDGEYKEEKLIFFNFEKNKMRKQIVKRNEFNKVFLLLFGIDCRLVEQINHMPCNQSQLRKFPM